MKKQTDKYGCTIYIAEHPDEEQGSQSWWDLRRGMPSASNFDRILTPKTCKPSASQEDYIDELCGDVFGEFLPADVQTWTSRPMTHGTNTEPEARQWFAMTTGREIQRVVGIISPCGRFWCSPDGLVGEDEGLELKCPMGKKQSQTIRQGRKMPLDHRPQVQGSLIISCRPRWNFLSYASGFDAVWEVIEPDDYGRALRDELERFHAKYQAALQLIRGPAKGDAWEGEL